MKQTLTIRSVSLLTAALGGIALVLRLCLYAFGIDEKGLLVPFHPLEVLLWLLTAAVAVLILAFARKADISQITVSHEYAAAGCFLFAAGICFTVVTSQSALPVLAVPAKVAGFLSVASLVWLGICRWKQQRPFFVFHAAVCLYLTLYTTCHYQLWSSRPQLQDSFFPMMGCIGLMLFSYYQTAADVDMGKMRMQLGCGLLAAFACICAISGSADFLLYLTGGVWALTNLCCGTNHKED